MKIAGLVKTSLIDYPGRVSAVIFTQGCNFKCGFCHNPDLVPVKGDEAIPVEELFSFLNKRVRQLEAVVVTGGEPTIQADLPEFLQKVKELDYMVKLDTNGSNPVMLAHLLEEDLVDFVAMDIKSDLDSYEAISGYPSTKVIQTSVKLILESGIAHEFRTTYLPRLHSVEKAKRIAGLVKGADLYSVQGFRPGTTLNPAFSKEDSFSRDQLAEIAQVFDGKVREVRVLDNL